MRPLSLTLRGFRSHVGETSFDFENRSLIAIVGPTGAGKSTILDGISYALYAKTPREKHSSRNLISTREKKAAITYRFAVEGETFEINRSIPAASDDHMVAVGTGEKVVGSGAITAKVGELLGLDFDGFASSVLLAQGRFDLFLKATTKERTGILKGIFRIEKVDELRKAAVTRRDGIDTELAMIEGERKQIPSDAAEQLKSSTAQVASLEKRIAELEKAVPKERDLLDREKDAATEIANAEGQIEALTEAVIALPRAEILEELADEESACASSIKDATTTLESSKATLEKAAADLHGLQEKYGEVRALHSARGKAESIATLEEELAELATEISALEVAVAAAEEELTVAKASETKANADLSTARAQVDELKRVHAAHALRAHLVPGEPCPVCEQTVGVAPEMKKIGDLDVAEAALAVSEDAVRRAREAVTEVEKKAAGEKNGLKSSAEANEKAKAKLAVARAAVEEIVGKVRNPLVEIDRRLEQLDAAVAAREAALKERDEAQKALNDCASVRHALDEQRRKHAEVLIQLAVKLDVAPPSVTDPARSLIEKVEAMSERAAARGEELRARIDSVAVKIKKTAEELAVLREKAGVESSLSEAVAEAKTERGVAQHVVADLTKKVARAEELVLLEKGLRSKRALFHQLADDLTDRHFVNFLLEDRRRLLSELASERLHEMTKRYRFSEDGEFDIVDELEGDVVRGADTLSGGETFLASLALALGLAETATRHGGRLQSFFLDEGFDSLDAEMLDHALDGIERIVTPERLIALVSHVPALGARVEDKIVLAKDADGCTIVAAGATGTR